MEGKVVVALVWMSDLFFYCSELETTLALVIRVGSLRLIHDFQLLCSNCENVQTVFRECRF